MLSNFTGAEKVYILRPSPGIKPGGGYTRSLQAMTLVSRASPDLACCGYTDLRQGIDGLSALVKLEFNLDPFSNTLFLFCGRRRDRIKALYIEGGACAD